MVLEDRIAIVTGCATGIGKAIARAFVLEGGWVAIADLGQDIANEIARTIDPSGRRVTGIGMDAADERQVEEAIAKVIQTFGGLDILVDNASVRITAPVNSPFATWKQTLASNLDGAFLIARAALSHMYKQKGGCLIFVAPLLPRELSLPEACHGAVTQGLIGLAKAVARSGAPYGIRVNVICPGPVSIHTVDGRIRERTNLPVAPRENLIETEEGFETATVDDVAEVALFLASFGSNALSGQTISLS